MPQGVGAIKAARRPRKAPEQSANVTGAASFALRTARATKAAARQRALAAAQPQAGAAMVKVIGYRKSVDATLSTLNYILRKADRAEDDWSRDVASPRDAIADWNLRDDDGRQVVHVLLSLPNHDPDAEWRATNDAARACFPNSPFVCALHTDTENPHVHVVVRMRDYRGKKLRIDRDALYGFRKTLASAGRGFGIAVEARRYDVPTRSRNRLRVFSEREPLPRQLDRQIAVLHRPADATPSQIRKACKTLAKRHAKLDIRQRYALLRAVKEMEVYPQLERKARAMCKVAFKGPRGDRFAVRKRQSEDIRGLAAEDPEVGPDAPDRATVKERTRVAKRLITEIDDLSRRDRDELRAKLGQLTPRMANKVRKALDRSASPIEDALLTLRGDSSPRQARKAIRRLAKHRSKLTAYDRTILRRHVLPRLADMPDRAEQARLVAELARRPRSTAERVVTTARELATDAARGIRKAAAAVRAPESPERPPVRPVSSTQRRLLAIDHAIEKLAMQSKQDLGATARTLHTLVRHRDLFTHQHRQQLGRPLSRANQALAAGAAPRWYKLYVKVLEGLVRSGQDGREFEQKQRIQQSMQALARLSRGHETSNEAERDRALRDVRSHVSSLDRDQRAVAREAAARLASDPVHRRGAKKLDRALDKTASLRERAHAHIERALDTLGDLANARRRDRRHALEALRHCHPFLTGAHRTRLRDRAAELAKRPKFARLAARLTRLAEPRAPQRTTPERRR